jgi:flagellar biogenesis protein FliO
MDYIILFLGIIGLVLSLLMKFSKAAQKAFGLNDPTVNKKYTSYKTSFLIVVCTVLIIFEGVAIVYPAMSGKYDGILALVLIVAILVDTFVKKRMRKEDKK